MSALPVSQTVALLDRPGPAALALDPLRAKLLAALRSPDSAAGLARRMDLPRQKINHHIRTLERAGLVELVEERRKGNCVERVMRASASYYLVAPQALGELSADRPDKVRDKFSWAYLVTVCAKAVRDLTTLRRRADRAEKKLPTFTLETELSFASPGSLSAFAEDLSNEIARLALEHAAKPQNTGETRRFSFFMGAYPTITKDGNEQPLADKEPRDGDERDG